MINRILYLIDVQNSRENCFFINNHDSSGYQNCRGDGYIADRFGYGDGIGMSDCNGSTCGYGYGWGYEYGSGDWCDNSCGSDCGDGDGYGDANGFGYEDGYGDANGFGYEDGVGDGFF